MLIGLDAYVCVATENRLQRYIKLYTAGRQSKPTLEYYMLDIYMAPRSLDSIYKLFLLS